MWCSNDITSCTFRFICRPFFIISKHCYDLPTMQSTRVGSKPLIAQSPCLSITCKKDIVYMLFLSESTVYRTMRSYGPSALDFSDICDDELDCHLPELSKEFPFCGEGLMTFLVGERGIKVQRISIHRVDEKGVSERQKGRLQHRVYNVQGPNHFWYIDTNHKRVRFVYPYLTYCNLIWASTYVTNLQRIYLLQSSWDVFISLKLLISYTKNI